MHLGSQLQSEIRNKELLYIEFVLVKITGFDPKFATIYQNCTSFATKGFRIGKHVTLLQNSIFLDW